MSPPPCPAGRITSGYPTAVLLLVVSVSFATEPDCRACCAAAGVSDCETTLRAYGEGESRVSKDSGGWQVQGAYVVGCDGRAWFDEQRTVYLDHQPRPGEVIMPEAHPLAVRCFIEACRTPRDTLVVGPDPTGNWTLRVREAARAPTAMEMRRIPEPVPTARRTVVILGDTPLLVEAVTAPAAAALPAPPPTATMDPLTTLLDLTPPDPPSNCVPPSEAVASQARRMILDGDDKRVRGDLVGAIQTYRAALSMSGCDAFGWVGLGEVARVLDRPDLAIRSFQVATRLLPSHYGAWVALGAAYEEVGQTTLAHRAYERALAARPDHAEANAGWRRTGP